MFQPSTKTPILPQQAANNANQGRRKLFERGLGSSTCHVPSRPQQEHAPDVLCKRHLRAGPPPDRRPAAAAQRHCCRRCRRRTPMRHPPQARVRVRNPPTDRGPRHNLSHRHPRCKQVVHQGRHLQYVQSAHQNQGSRREAPVARDTDWSFPMPTKSSDRAHRKRCQTRTPTCPIAERPHENEPNAHRMRAGPLWGRRAVGGPTNQRRATPWL
mmetsp:Transcript_62548/g.204128  ORF Transcript_62548/g.204128 Transcript_62548/m.204128 type:complete len:213 (-) Transcript_62548:38-676(-)